MCYHTNVKKGEIDMAHAVMEGAVDYEYFSLTDKPTFKNPNKSPVVDKLNGIINNMIVSDINDDYSSSLIYRSTNNYKLEIAALGKDYPEEKYEAKRSCSGLKVFTIIDNNDPSENKRFIDPRGFVSPIDNSQTSYVSVPLVYCGKELARRLDPFSYDEQINGSNYLPLYPPQWDIVRRNYPEYRTMVDAEITKRYASYAYKKMFYSDSNGCWMKCGTSRVRALVEFITDKYYNECVLARLQGTPEQLQTK